MINSIKPLEPEVIPDNSLPTPVIAQHVMGDTFDTVNKNFKDQFTVGTDKVRIDPINGRIIVYDSAGVARIVIGFLKNGF